jgi:hypothetical protein
MFIVNDFWLLGIAEQGAKWVTPEEETGPRQSSPREIPDAFKLKRSNPGDFL